MNKFIFMNNTKCFESSDSDFILPNGLILPWQQ